MSSLTLQVPFDDGDIPPVGGGFKKFDEASGEWRPFEDVNAKQMQPQPKGREKTMFSEVASDVKTFIVEHKSVIYFLAVALIVDHLMFKGAFRARLQAVVERMVSKVENKIAA